ncbi:MAG: hypothetical protein ABJN84_08440 [Flavobacteriaceae bacterium]
MKNISTITVALILSLNFISCNEDEQISIVENSSKLQIEFKQTSKLSLEKLNNWTSINANTKITGLFGKNSDVPIDFDFENPISYDSNGTETVIVNQKNLDEVNYTNYAISFLNNSNEFNQFVIIKTINESNSIKKVEYYSFNNNLLFTTIFDSQSQKIITLTSDNEKVKPQNILNKENGYDCDASWGENTAACLDDAYSNHGWISVWAVVQSAFIPQTAAALTAACAIDAYNPYDGDGCYQNQ